VIALEREALAILQPAQANTGGDFLLAGVVTSPPMLIECPHCRARVNAEEKGAAEWLYESEVGDKGGRLDRLLVCPACGSTLLSRQQMTDYDDAEGAQWGPAKRLWPSTDLPNLGSMPPAVRHALSEADRAMYGEAYSASVVMSVQALEGICRHFETENDNLFKGLAELLKRNIIDKMLYEWGQELRKHRNLAAHATGTKFSRLDAQDIFDFARAICEYVFVLKTRFERFKVRAAQRKIP
jgi:hypothetical protein